MEWKVGDLIDWDGTFPLHEYPRPPQKGGRIVEVFSDEYKVDWPNLKGAYHWKEGSAKRFTRHEMDTFDVDGVE